MYKVLIIEDDAMIGDMVTMYLSEEGFHVIRKANGAEGIAAVSQFDPDVILLDLMLPDMDGLALCRQVRETSKIPIMIVSMKSKVVERVNALGAGADDYMCKPFSMHEMSARVHALIRRSNLYLKSSVNTRQVTGAAGGSTTAVLEAVLDIDKKITLNPNTRSMRVHGVLVETTYSEFEIMKCFVNHPGRVYSREDLLQTVRGFDSLVTDRAIDVHIANLRKKIEDNPKEPKWIRTVWGVGYKFVY
ncbi:DNA-binding response OmpR family regulator [Paenibacillus sp. V4I3]|uniref:response regulator transcription factor n=1 Tax=unclassified Paenibacillus TaxID=185978 RepID=UPI0027881E31|nr:MULTISPECIES: response regulator transcription factor [unclassified Paenibacillus]MDQ0878210.1 DNA-binding response OmpR family regulator [Paenibacillus sp. V4I3]MDQ0885963.1 DNA-binding response OmpR family regulator [Paenibacillus sp. V4I9]